MDSERVLKIATAVSLIAALASQVAQAVIDALNHEDE